MTRSHRGSTLWKGPLLAAALLFPLGLGLCSHAAACGDACSCDERGDRGLLASGSSSCGSEAVLFSSGESRPIQKSGANVLAASREAVSSRSSLVVLRPALRERASAKSDILYLLHDSLLV